MMVELIDIKPKANYRLWLRYADGASGEVDLSEMVGQGVFRVWDDPDTFQRVRLKDGVPTWDRQIDLCPDSLYMRLTGQTPEQVFPNLSKQTSHA